LLENGHIKLHRSLLNWEWYSDLNTRVLFIHLLLVANWRPERWQGVMVERGQRATSYASLANETGLSVQNVRTSLKRLISTGTITCAPYHKFTVISIKNYEKYQNGNRQPTGGQQAVNTPLTTNEEGTKAIQPTASVYSGALERLVGFYEDNRFGAIARSHCEEMAAYLNEGVDAPLIERCMKEAVDNGVATWAYARRIIERCVEQKVLSVEAFDAGKARRAAGPTRSTAPKTAGASRFLREDL
jgi:DnaD/phage-associated family protein